MRRIRYSCVIMLIVVAALSAESFIQKKAPSKKQPRIKQEDIAVTNGELLKKSTQLSKKMMFVQEIIVNDTHEIIEQKNKFGDATQQQLHTYQASAKKIQDAYQECEKIVNVEYERLKNCFIS